MSDSHDARRAAHFSALYRANPDPWNDRDSAYELEKYQKTLAVLPKRRFHAALELGCSVGVLTGLLAARADHVTAIDLSEEALREARAQLAGQSHIRLIRAKVPGDWPGGSWDLILLSEMLYCLTPAEITGLCARIAASARAGAHCLMVNWTGETGTSWRGREAAEATLAGLKNLGALRRAFHHDHGSFVINHLILRGATPGAAPA